MDRLFFYGLFIFFYLFAVGFTESKKTLKDSKLLLGMMCFGLTFIIGFRDGWPDQEVYVGAFNRYPLLFEFSEFDQPYGYVEKGYMYLASFVKTIYNSSRFYLLCMGGLSMYMLYKCLHKYCIIPLIGIFDYVARFMLNRDFIQMRSSLVILLIVLTSKFIYERKAIKYFLVVLLAYQFHHMALIGIPMYFLYPFKLTRKYIVFGLLFSMVLSQTLADAISSTVDAYSEDLQYETYVEGNYVEAALGLRNPMIWFQTGVLLLFAYSESWLRPLTKYYDLLIMGYFYSTLILIFFCNYTALSGRTSTMFATYEMFMLPLIIKGANKRNRWLFYLGIGFTLFYFFINKYNDAMMHMTGGGI